MDNERTQTMDLKKKNVELAVELFLKVINLKPNDLKPQCWDHNEFICLIIKMKMRLDCTKKFPESIPKPLSVFPFDGSQ